MLGTYTKEIKKGKNIQHTHTNYYFEPYEKYIRMKGSENKHHQSKDKDTLFYDFSYAEKKMEKIGGKSAWFLQYFNFFLF